jgi:hypothetical protein
MKCYQKEYLKRFSALVQKHEIGKCFTQVEVQAMIDYIESLVDNHEYHKILCRNSLFGTKQYDPEYAQRFMGDYSVQINNPYIFKTNNFSVFYGLKICNCL